MITHLVIDQASNGKLQTGLATLCGATRLRCRPANQESDRPGRRLRKCHADLDRPHRKMLLGLMRLVVGSRQVHQMED